MMLTTEQKLQQLLQTADGHLKKKLKDLADRGVTYGGFTLKQIEWIARMYDGKQEQQTAAAAVKFKHRLGEYKKTKEEAKCWDCGDSGFIRLSRKGVFEEWARWHEGSAPCHCSLGKELIEAGRRKKEPIDFGPQFNDRWKKSYEVIPIFTDKSGVYSGWGYATIKDDAEI